MEPLKVMSNLNPYLFTWEDIQYVFSEKKLGLQIANQFTVTCMYLSYVHIGSQLYVCIYMCIVACLHLLRKSCRPHTSDN